jgi:hypothetical protein
MKKIFAILMALCLLTVFVSAASACIPGYNCPPNPTICKTQYLSSTNTQIDQTNGDNYIGQQQTAVASSADGYYKVGPFVSPYIDGTVSAHQEQSGELTDSTATASQYTSVNADGINAYAKSTQKTDITVGDGN